MRRRLPVIAMVLLVSVPIVAQRPATPAPPPAAPEPGGLPVRRVVLYKTGVGYFEHLGNVRDRQDVTIRFTSAQLNDVLKSLTTIDLGSGRVTGISYNSVAPIDQRLSALRLPIGEDATTVDLLAALRGARIEVSSGSLRLAGRLLGVEQQQREKNGETVRVATLAIVTTGGEMRSVDLTPAVRVRILDGDLRQEVSRYLDVVGSAREQDVRRMVITTAGTGERPLFVSYVSEVPIWKTTYRLVLRERGEPLLQGWAIIDNTIGEDWKGVELSLVAGAPQSFIQDVSQPYYGRRPTVSMPQAAQVTPQTHQAAISRHVYGVGNAAPTAAPTAAPSPATRDLVQPRQLASRVGGNVASGIPGGTVGGVVGGLPEAPPSPATRAYQVEQTPAADAAAIGDLFEYRIKEPVTLQKNQSALVPIVSAAIGVEKVALWNRAQGHGRPLRAAWLTNASGLTLDGGSISVIDGDAFAGEGLIESMKPGERRLLSYAADVGVLMDARASSTPGRLLRVRARDGVVIQETEERSTWTYSARSEEARPVTLVIEHRRRQGWTLASGQTPIESTPDTHRFRLVVEPGQEATLTVREARAAQLQIAVGDFNEIHLSHLAAAGSSSAALQRALAPVLARRTELAELEKHVAALERRRHAIAEDQLRLRENMKALRGSNEEKQLLRRYTKQLDDQESELGALRTELGDVTARRDRARADVNALIAAFDIEMTD